MLIITAKRNGCLPEQCGRTLTVGEFIKELKCFDADQPIYLSHDNSYTYGSITENDLNEQQTESESEDLDETEEMGEQTL